MSNTAGDKKFWTALPPIIFIGALAVLFPISAFMTIESVNRQKDNSIRLLMEKGAALIRSFEAGTRTGIMMGMHGTRFKLQRLLAETAQQPDIMHLIVTDIKGTILAHSDSSKLGKIYGKDLELLKIFSMKGLSWRIVSNSDKKEIVFEIFRKFLPSQPRMNMHRSHIMQKRYSQYNMDKKHNNDCLLPRIIFVGLDMTPVEEARKSDTRHTVIMGFIMLLIGLAGIVLLFMTQNYRAAKVSLSRIKAFSDNVVENMPIGLIAVDHNRRIASVNHTAESLLSLPSRGVVGEYAYKILSEKLLDETDEPVINDTVIEKEIEYPLKDGGTIPLEISVNILKEENNILIGTLFLLKDLTEVRALRKEIARSQRLASVGRLAAGIAHEIRNPLSSIKGFATYFKKKYENIPENQEIANIMIQEIDRLNRVIGQLLELARPISISRRPVILRELIQNSIKMVEQDAKEKRIILKTEISPCIETILIDPDRINQVLLNLYLNAIDAMEGTGGVLSVSVNNRDDKFIDITVSDTGTGIIKEDIAHIFDPYFTRKASGTGLGLAIVYNIIEAHKGELGVLSEIGQGTEISISIPYSEEILI
jgi:two-component system sensor histidine kinase HydH